MSTKPPVDRLKRPPAAQETLAEKAPKKSMKESLEALGIKVSPPSGTGFVIGGGGYETPEAATTGVLLPLPKRENGRGSS